MQCHLFRSGKCIGKYAHIIYYSMILCMKYINMIFATYNVPHYGPANAALVIIPLDIWCEYTMGFGGLFDVRRQTMFRCLHARSNNSHWMKISLLSFLLTHTPQLKKVLCWWIWPRVDKPLWKTHKGCCYRDQAHTKTFWFTVDVADSAERKEYWTFGSF